MANTSPDLSILGSRTRVTGRIEGEGALRIEGHIQGDISLDGALEIASGASIEGNVDARALEVAGSVRGDISASGAVVIRAGASVRGDVRAAQVTVEPGSRIAIRLDADFELDLANPSRAR
jgi:cytoskeletal protein CcmA (bactofilin family)